jgi:DNA-binding transcriptional regulator YhcF (GntR family)
MTSKNKKLQNEQEIVKAIKEWYATNNYGPSYRDLSLMTNISLGTVHNICKDLRNLGIIQYEDNVARTIKLKEKA